MGVAILSATKISFKKTARRLSTVVYRYTGVVTDCGTTKDHLELTDIQIGNYREKLNAIKERFYIKEDTGAFIMETPTDSIESVKMRLGYFIQAISVIANIDL